MPSTMLADPDLTEHERAELECLLARSPRNPPDLADIWRLMDLAWDEMGCDNRHPDAKRLAAFYRHPVWLLNGLFVEQHALSQQHRQAIVAWLRQHTATRILDYGGGYGSLARMIAAALPDRQIDLFEPYPGRLALVKMAAYPNLRVLAALEGSYDCVICQDVLEHVPDPFQLLGDIVSVLQLGGVVLFANNFYPVIKCHLPGTFHLRYTFPLLVRYFGLERSGTCPGSTAVVYRKVAAGPVQWAQLRRWERLSRAIYPLLRAAHRGYQRLRGRRGAALTPL